MLELTPLESEALGLSLRVAVWSVAASLPFGLAMAWLLARYEFFGKTLLNGIVHLPLVLPPVVVGYLLLVLFGRRGPRGARGRDTVGSGLAVTGVGAALAAGGVAVPRMVGARGLSIETVDQKLETAARTQGAKRTADNATKTQPQKKPGNKAGAEHA
jgi:molybdate transport system permease protein